MEHCPRCGGEVFAEHRFCPTCAEPLSHDAPAADPFLNQVIGGSYLVHQLIGEGGMGRVYRAEQVALGKSVAIKVIHGHLVGDESAIARFYTEAKAASRLNHPNCVAVIDFGKTEGGQLYLVMEYLRGNDLGRILAEEGSLPPNRVADICRQVCAALADAHALGIIHRDLKPDNVLVEPLRTGGDFVKVVDFGLAKIQLGPRDRPITSAGIVCGTPEYMSPEQGRGNELDGRSDLYGLGVVLYEALTGDLPFAAESPTEVVLKHITEPPIHPRERAPHREIPEDLAAIAMRALQKAREDRYQTAEEMAAALDEWLLLARHQTSGRVCRSCGRVNPIISRFCAACGSRLVETPAEVQHEAPGPAPSEAPGAAHVELGRSQTVPDLRLVGREKALSALLQFRRDASQEGVVVCLIGEHGVGKSRLVAEATEKTTEGGGVAVLTGPDPTWARVGYHATRTLLAKLLELSPEATEQAVQEAGRRRDLGPEALAGLREVFSEKGAEDLDPQARVHAAAQAVRAVVERVTSEHGLLIVIDDLHRCDSLSQATFSALTRRPVPKGLVLVGLHPPGFETGWADPKILEVGGLTTSHARLLLARRAHGMASPPDLPESLEARQAIPPLYVDQLVRFVQEGGGTPPETLVDLVSARVGILPHEARLLLQCAAILGESSALTELAGVAGPDVALDEALQILREREFLAVDGARVRFPHAIIADIVAAGIPASARRDLHGRAAEALASRGAPLEVRAHHIQQTDGGFAALLLLERAGNLAARRGDRTGAIEYFRRGLELARQEISRGEMVEPEKPMLLFSAKLARALLAAGEGNRADAVLHEALGMGLAGPAERAELLSVLAQTEMKRGKTKAALAHAREAAEAGANLPAAASRAALQIDLGRLLLRAGDAAGASFAIGEALETLGEARHSSKSDRELRTDALLLLSECQQARKNNGLAMSMALEALGLADATGLRAAMGRALVRVALAAAADGDAETAEGKLQEAASLFEQLGDGIAANEAREAARIRVRQSS